MTSNRPRLTWVFLAALPLLARADGLRDIDRAGPDAASAAEAVAMMVDTAKLKTDSAGNYLLNWQKQNYCADHPFRGQKKLDGGYCSSFLIGSNMVATAGHCLRGKTCEGGISFVFGIKDNSPAAPKDNVYNCKAVKYMKAPGAEGKTYHYTEDLAIITLDRPVKGRKRLDLDFSAYDSNSISSRLDMGLNNAIGYPDGLPVKASTGMRTGDGRKEENGVGTTAQIVGGMSGGPVVSILTGKVVGVNLTGSPTLKSAKTGCRYIPKFKVDETGRQRTEDGMVSGYGYATIRSLRGQIPEYSVVPGQDKIEFMDGTDFGTTK